MGLCVRALVRACAAYACTHASELKSACGGIHTFLCKPALCTHGCEQATKQKCAQQRSTQTRPCNMRVRASASSHTQARAHARARAHTHLSALARQGGARARRLLFFLEHQQPRSNPCTHTHLSGTQENEVSTLHSLQHERCPPSPPHIRIC